MNIIGNRKFYYAISGVFIILSIGAMILWQLRPGIDFKGGAILELVYSPDKRPPVNSAYESLKGLNLNDLRITPVGDDGLTLRFRETDEAVHQKIVALLTPMEERRFSSIGPTIGAELKQKSLRAIALVLLGISLYIAWAFRQVSKPLNSWRYGVATLIALFHDLIIPLGLFSYLGHFYNVEIGTNFIVALLVVLGFSVHDTIVVFDRIRENLKRYSLDFENLVNQSVNETLVRSINTSLTVLLTLAALYFFGSESLKYFILALIVGIFSGTYSSIFIASPILVSWFNFLNKKKPV
ncbi:protein-export membrane protein SecF [Candidatus Azambacteria bacterium RIFOXYD1_FULL_42_11]|uniref:Protein-export membrane protein SecF n=3 Tax=Candidatus Azamiibacteriota TaxID=1752741 RepID=A0A1F5CJQ2_9BACT|nr:MAG: Protein translocase subunit SecF [Candidatus Azambacteria bacterium GW2011_GWB1_42_17]KKS76155.1 MAG: Protein translocase subunit SecF [Candidatus Azambacteria bacterium GW2011_GWA2_42_9]KKS88213.1 MAG: Protein translocase subunit SecF [Parcubacteria group bacterium GW2011_GWC1_43_11]OGD43063.1 MAG: protein-export membrane protein SecF [Candidatus Azambacteria bacterium RIFOXYD1_FULL_42_11]